MFYNKLKMDSVAEAVKQIMSEEESGLRMAAHAAHRQGKKMFSFQGKTYPVRVQGEEVTYGEAFEEEADCVTEPKAKEIAKKVVGGHEKKMHKEEKEDNPSAKMSAAYGKGDTEETPARKTIKAHGGPVAQPKMGLAKEETELDEAKSETKKEFQARQGRLTAAHAETQKNPDRMARMMRIPGYADAMKLAQKTTQKEEVEELDEREMTSGEKSEKERLVKSMKKGFKGFRERYGKRAKSVMYATATKRAMGEEVEQLEEGKMDHMSLSHLWHAHAKHSYAADQGYGSGSGSMHHNDHAATAIENHVRKHHGNKVADDMVHHSELHVAHAEYVGGKEAKEVEHQAEKLRKKHGIKGDLYGHHEMSMKEEVEQIDELKKSTLGSYVKKASRNATIQRKIGADFETMADKSRKPSSKAAATELSDKYKAKSRSRLAGIEKATDRLAKEEVVDETVDTKKKTMDTLAGRVKVPADTHNQHTSTKVELKAEGWEDMMKAVKDRAKPQPSGGSGVKLGSRYGGGKQTSKPEHDDEDKKKVKESHVEPKGKMLLEPEKTTAFKKNPVPANKPAYKLKAFSTESKRPDQENVPFVTSESKPLSVAKDLAHKAMKRIKNEMLGKPGTSE